MSTQQRDNDSASYQNSGRNDSKLELREVRQTGTDREAVSAPKEHQQSRMEEMSNGGRSDVSKERAPSDRRPVEFNQRSTAYGTFAQRSRERENQPVWRSQYAQQRERQSESNMSNYRQTYQRNSSIGEGLGNHSFEYKPPQRGSPLREKSPNAVHLRDTSEEKPVRRVAY